MQHNSFTLLTTLLLCASTGQLISEQSLKHENRITVQDLNKDLIYIETFLMKLHNEDLLITGEEFQSINHDLNQIKKYVKGIGDADYKNKTNLAKKVVYLQKVTHTQKHKADLDKKNKKLKKLDDQTTKKEISLISARTAAQVLTKREEKKKEKPSAANSQRKKQKENDLAEFLPYLFPSSGNSHQPITQPNAKKNENISSNAQTTSPHIFIKNMNDKPITIQYATTNEMTVKEYIAPGEKSARIVIDNIKKLFWSDGSGSKAIDISNITESKTIVIKPKTSLFSFISGESFEQQAEPA